MADGEDWEAQVEELVALQSIFDARFRLRTDVAAGASGSCGDAGPPPPDDEALMALMGQPRPAGLGLLRAEVLVDAELPPDGLQLRICGAGGGEGGGGENGGGEIGGDKGGGSASRGIPVGGRVRWLPPLVVSIELPAAYPSAEPPRAAVSAGWLSALQPAALEAGLQEAWEKQGAGCPVLFTFLEWLRGAALERLGISAELPLYGSGATTTSSTSSSSSPGKQQQRSGCSTGDKHSPHQQQHPHQQQQQQQPQQSSSHQQQHQQQHQKQQQQPHSPGAEQVAVQLLRYHAAKEQEEFDEARHRCAVCFDDLPGAACLRLPCNHFFCRGCLQQMAASNVREGSLEALRCPDPACRLTLPPHVLGGLLSADEYARWEELLLARTLDRMADVVYCPRCECACIEDKDHFAQCAECLFAFCSLCCSSWHPGSACVDEEQALLIMSRRRARGGAGARDTRAEMDLVQQLASLRVLKEISKPCPSCKISTEKTEGCNKMACTNCGAFWCWRCDVEISGYDHFKEGGCRLFEQAEIDRWNAMFAAERAEQEDVGHRGMALGPMGAQRARVAHCPACRQATFQLARNNLIRCWACAQHFCAACRTILRGRVGQHYIGAKSCKQHD